MKIDVVFSIAKVYNVDERIDVTKGQKFALITDAQGTTKWFSDNDPVLDVEVSGNNAQVEATALGTSMIQIQDENKNVLKELTISVLAAIVPEATALNLSAHTQE